MLKRYLTFKVYQQGAEKPDLFTIDLLNFDPTKNAFGRAGGALGYGSGYTISFDHSDKEPSPPAKIKYFRLRDRVLARLGFRISPFAHQVGSPKNFKKQYFKRLETHD